MKSRTSLKSTQTSASWPLTPGLRLPPSISFITAGLTWPANDALQAHALDDRLDGVEDAAHDERDPEARERSRRAAGATCSVTMATRLAPRARAGRDDAPRPRPQRARARRTPTSAASAHSSQRSPLGQRLQQARAEVAAQRPAGGSARRAGCRRARSSGSSRRPRRARIARQQLHRQAPAVGRSRSALPTSTMRPAERRCAGARSSQSATAVHRNVVERRARGCSRCSPRLHRRCPGPAASGSTSVGTASPSSDAQSRRNGATRSRDRATAGRCRGSRA